MSHLPLRRWTRCALALAAVIPALTLPALAHASAPSGKQKSTSSQVVFEDTFNGANWTMPDATKWALINAGGGFGNGELQFYTKDPENISLDGQSHLRITAQRVRDHDRGFYYTSGKLVSLMYPFFYGHASARIRVPSGQGMWPAFWMLGVGDGPLPGQMSPFNAINPLNWPTNGEIDVMEAIGRTPKTVYGSIHGPVKQLQGQPESYDHTGTMTLKKPLSAGWHTYAVDSAPGLIKFSVDGTVYKTLKREDMKAGEDWVYDRPFKLILNLAVGGDWPGPPTSRTRFPSTMLVDWVRVTSTGHANDPQRS